MYSNSAERAYFTTDACAHVATRDEHDRLRMIEKRNRDALRTLERRTGSRVR
jgi:hypothetical protein